MQIRSGQSILFTGDSITDCGRGRPVGAGAGLGNGYVSIIDAFLASSHPDHPITTLNTGISGNTVVDLAARWQTDVLDVAPDWLSMLIGINDVWRQFDLQPGPGQVRIDRYETTYRALLEETRPLVRGLVLMSPYVIEPDFSDPMRARMDAYGSVVKQLALEFDGFFVDLQAAFDRYLAHRSALSLSDDRIHPNQIGHMIIARSFLAVTSLE